MNKKDAAEYLGVSTRAIERYVSKGKLNPEYVKGRTGQAPDFNESDLERLKKDMESAAQIPGFQTGEKMASNNTALTTRNKPNAQATQQFLDLITTALQHPKDYPNVPIVEKISLTMQEAVELSGCSKRALEEAIRSNQIKHDKNGRHGSLRLSKDDVVKFAKKF